MSKKKYISVFIPTYNGQKYISELLDAVLNQKVPADYELEILVTDSGSTDSTVTILEKYYKDKIHLFQIPNSEFGHGKTRQSAAEKARGEFILFLSQDATPSSENWARDLVEPFFISDAIGCVFGRQVPRPTSVATIKREVSGVFAGLGAPDSLVIHRSASLVDGNSTNPINTFFSDVNSAVRASALRKVPFRDVAYAEDQALAEDMQNAGYLKGYSVRGAVWHSNEYTVREYYKRKFDEYIGLMESVAYRNIPSLRALVLGWIRPTLADWRFTLRDNDYTRRYKLKNLVLSAGYNIANYLGKYHAAKYYNDPEKRSQLSLEKSRK